MRLSVFAFLMFALASYGQIGPSGDVRAAAFVGMSPNGAWEYMMMPSGLGPSGDVLPIAPVGLGADGNWHYMSMDAHGNLLLPGLTASSSTFYLDGTRTDTYTSTGSLEFPFKTLDQLIAGLAAYVGSGGTGPVAVWSNPSALYSTSIATTIPAIPLIVYGNNSTWTFLAGVINDAIPFTVYDLNTVGNVTYAACSSTTRSERHGGSYAGGNVVLGAGCYSHMYGVNLSGNGNTLTVNGLLYGEALTGSMKIASGSTSATIALYNPNMTKSSDYNVDMTAGGQLLLNGGLLSTASGTANVYLPTANSTTTAHSISGLITSSGTGIACTSGTAAYLVLGPSLTAVTSCTLLPSSTGPISIPSIKSTTGTRYVCISTTGLLSSSATPCAGT